MHFSVVIPLYNKREYIARCLQSVLGQTHADFEILVVNDGSTDGGELELEQFPDRRLRVINQPNLGVSVARNTGVEAAHHDIVVFLDADDTWEPTLLEEISHLVNSHPYAGVFACGTRKVFSDGRILECSLDASAFDGKSSILRDYFMTFADLGQSPFSNSSFGVRKEIFHRAGGYTPGVKLTEDSDLWVRLALICKVAFNTRPLANYFVETDGNTRIQAQTSDYEVIKTLTRVLAEGLVAPHLRRGAESLLAFQKNSQIKRLILLGSTGTAWRRLLDRDVWNGRLGESLLLALAASLPPSLFRRLRGRRTAKR